MFNNFVDIHLNSFFCKWLSWIKFDQNYKIPSFEIQKTLSRFKIVNKRERWGLTGWGCLLLFVLIAIGGWIFVSNIVPFLSKEKTIDARVMVLEGYIPDFALPGIIKIFNEKNYEFLIATGTTYDQGFYLSGVASSADLIGNSLKNLGFDTTRMAIVPAPANVLRDRTYHTGIAVKTYLEKYHPEVKKINLISLGVHARRSHYLYKLAFGDQTEVGNIVIPERIYDKSSWYKTSLGFRNVINEVVGYFYVRCFFIPEKKK